MSFSILSVAIRSEHDTVAARQRARQIARLLGFDQQDQTRISTAVSEIARNAFNYAGGGRVEYLIEGRTAPQLFLVKVMDDGPGIADLTSILDGRYESQTGMGLGILGARRLMDQFQIDSIPGRGTTVFLKKLLAKRAPLIQAPDVARIAGMLAREIPQDAFQELQYQNQELVRALEEIRARQVELTRLNRELEDTNRGVVALYAELDEKADHLRRADELKSRFLSNMSHEFRSPLNSILALSRLMLDGVDGQLNSEHAQEVGYIRKAAYDLLELVDDLLDLAKVEAGKVEAKPVEFTAANLFAALRGMLRPLLLNQSVDLVFEDADHIPPIYSDEGKVSQILRNFISNALKFTDSGEVRVSAALGEHRDVIFSVADTGIGIEEENLELIFQDFAQVDSPIQRRVKGTGLGLPLSKKLATLLGGEVRVRSQVGLGSTFSVQIPLCYHAAEEAQNVFEPDWVGDPLSIPVLIVEDSPEMVVLYRSFLAGSGFQPLFASTTREAGQILDRTQPSAIVLDILLRSEEAWSFMARLTSETRTKDIPILVVSTLDDRAKAYHLGASHYLVKPIERSALISGLRTILGVTSSRQLLIIDDDEGYRYMIRQQLQGSGLYVTEAPDGSQGVRLACEDKPGGIILDLNMPGMTGFEVLERLKAETSTKDIPVVICTSRVLSDSERFQLNGKASAILSKEGLDRLALVQTLSRILTGACMAAPTG
jgi:signal transduction histidine kinase/CheY-like chemotaxis protein